MALNLKDAPRSVEASAESAQDPASIAFELAVAIEKHLNRIASSLEIIAESTFIEDEEGENEEASTDEEQQGT